MAPYSIDRAGYRNGMDRIPHFLFFLWIPLWDGTYCTSPIRDK